jgi:hypothetical protein
MEYHGIDGPNVESWEALHLQPSGDENRGGAVGWAATLCIHGDMSCMDV